MTETLTESFCERCGTRYEFKAPTRLNPLRKTRGLFGGLKNYLTSQDALSDAIGDAMRSEEESLAGAQLEAFHETFNFCISCRQYTCLNCWNDGEGRCRSCAPIAGTDDLAERLAASLAGAPVADGPPAPMTAGDPGFESWPTSDLPTSAPAAASEGWPVEDAGAPYDTARVAAEAAPEPAMAELESEPEPVATEAGPEPEPEPMVPVEAWTPEPQPVAAHWPPELEPEPVAATTGWEPEPVLVDADLEPVWEPAAAADDLDAQPIAAEAEIPARPALRVVSWDEDAELEHLRPAAEPPEPIEAEAEPDLVAAEAEAEPEPVVADMAPAPEPEPVVAEAEPGPEPETVAAEAEPHPEPAPLRPRIAPISETILRLPRQAPTPPPAVPPSARPAEPIAAMEDTPELAARRAQLDLLGLGDPGEGRVGPERPAVLPYRSRGAGTGAVPRAGDGGLWEASAREVAGAVGQIGVQSCGQCGLSLSASARFCRRCGTRQQQSA